jgi:hypothetical protein
MIGASLAAAFGYLSAFIAAAVILLATTVATRALPPRPRAVRAVTPPR